MSSEIKPMMVMGNDVLRFEFKGGEYINIFWAGTSEAHDVRNVFDYEQGKTTIQTLADFERACMAYWDDEADGQVVEEVEVEPDWATINTALKAYVASKEA
jgi:hypothetical protein